MFCFIYKDKDSGKTVAFIEALTTPDSKKLPIEYELIGVIDITSEFEARVRAKEEEEAQQNG